MMEDETCGQAVTYGSPGSTRYVGRCGRPVERDGLCRDHLYAQEYQLKQFREAMDNATRHWHSIAFHGKGVRCGGCDVMVLDGQEHPWDLNKVEEAAWWEGHPDAPHRPKDLKS